MVAFLAYANPLTFSPSSCGSVAAAVVAGTREVKRRVRARDQRTRLSSPGGAARDPRSVAIGASFPTGAFRFPTSVGVQAFVRWFSLRSSLFVVLPAFPTGGYHPPVSLPLPATPPLRVRRSAYASAFPVAGRRPTGRTWAL